jgi:hypothetical protein
VDEQEVLEKFMDMINQEDWSSEEIFTGDNIPLESRMLIATYLLPTPLPNYFLHIDVGYEYNPDLGRDIYGD